MPHTTHHTPSHKQLIPGSERPFLETNFFLRFSVRLSGNECSRVISMGDFGPTASNLRYDFWCQKAPHRHLRAVHWESGLNTNITIVITWNAFPIQSNPTWWDKLVDLGHSQNWPLGPKIGQKMTQIAQKWFKNQFCGF